MGNGEGENLSLLLMRYAIANASYVNASHGNWIAASTLREKIATRLFKEVG
ncbi:hypothetical protein H6G04_34130 [Calothrix membranacea FACHB-236]|nr:hypothetical protein [Calothrix membranacea FACHB-236]